MERRDSRNLQGLGQCHDPNIQPSNKIFDGEVRQLGFGCWCTGEGEECSTVSGAREDCPGGDHGEGSHREGGKVRRSSPGKMMWMVGDGFDSAIGCVEEGAGVASMGGLSLKAREVRAMALGLINSDKGWRSPGVGAPGYEERTRGLCREECWPRGLSP